MQYNLISPKPIFHYEIIHHEAAADAVFLLAELHEAQSFIDRDRDGVMPVHVQRDGHKLRLSRRIRDEAEHLPGIPLAARGLLDIELAQIHLRTARVKRDETRL
ncbi:MAG: hypothetical protein M0P13_12240, partial [Fibrobacteraceae bacterium]|nr:hypothetical protein [Fibrobacteraceae bacterium]